MILAVQLAETSRGPAPLISMQSEASAQDCSMPSSPLGHVPPADPREEMLLIEIRYRQHLAQRDLEELFENGVLEALWS
jgi:hypothetical protein